MPTANLLQTEHLTEHVSLTPSSRVDRARGVISRVRILGRVSKNGREYSKRAMEQAAQMYEGAGVNLDHPDRKNAGTERRIEDGFGWLESIAVEPDGVYGNLHYLTAHPLAGLVAEAAERRSNRFGLSHNAEGMVTKRGGKNVVESIQRVISVDLVQSPATNSGLFESWLGEDSAIIDRSGGPAMLPPDDSEMMGMGDGQDPVERAVLSVLRSTSLSSAAKMKWLAKAVDLVDELEKLEGAAGGAPESAPAAGDPEDSTDPAMKESEENFGFIYRDGRLQKVPRPQGRVPHFTGPAKQPEYKAGDLLEALGRGPTAVARHKKFVDGLGGRNLGISSTRQFLAENCGVPLDAPAPQFSRDLQEQLHSRDSAEPTMSYEELTKYGFKAALR